jgi:signal transduction histidine kinase/DNA-binding response OmpR family regulator/ligand-binding sensor domain-containing protein
MRNTLTILTIILFLATTKILEAQNSGRYIKTHYSIDNYLNDNAIQQSTQDGHGLMWFRTISAIIRFDGNEFRYYHHNHNDSLLQFGPDNIGPFLVDEKGTLWVNNLDEAAGSRYISTKLSRYDLSKDGFISYRPKVTSFVRSLSIEKQDTLVWLGSRTEGLYLYNFLTNEIWHYANEIVDKKDFERANHIRSIINQPDYLLLATNYGIWRFDKHSKTFTRPAEIPDTFMKGAIGLAENGRIILKWKPSGGVQIFEVDSKTFQIRNSVEYNARVLDFHGGVTTFITNDRKSILVDADGRVDTLLTESSSFRPTGCSFDAQGNVWLTTYDGIYKFTKSRLEVNKINIPFSDRKHFQQVRFRDKSQTIFLGVNNYIAISDWPPGSSPKTEFNFATRNDIYSNLNKAYQGRNNFWIAAWFRGVLKIPIDHDNQKLSANEARFLEPEPNNPYTISTSNPWTVFEDEEENLWIGHFDSGIEILNPGVAYGHEGSIVKRLRHDPKNQQSLSSDMIEDIIAGPGNSVLIGTGDGVDKYENGIITRMLKTGYRTTLVKSEDGDIYAAKVNTQPSECYQLRMVDSVSVFTKIYSGNLDMAYFLKDSKGRIWAPTTKGLVVFDPIANQMITLYDQKDFHYFDYLQRISDNEFMAVRSPIISFNPLELVADTTEVKTILSSLKVNNQEIIRPISGMLTENISTANVLVLDYLHNNFELKFSALDFLSPEKNLYRYMLEGYNKDWIETTSKNRTATYTNLNPGIYYFKVKASNRDQVWSDNERTLKVVILPPPWRTWWAYTGYLMLVAGLLYYARSNIVQRERLKANLKLEHMELEKAHEVDRVKTSFFTNISHEFRTPLTLIKGPVQNIIEQFVDDQKDIDKQKIVDQLKLVQRNSDHLLKLINQLLDLAKLESGSLKVEKVEGEVFSFVRAIASSFESFARQKDVSVLIDVPAETRNALFDKDKVETILINLINNAVKFTGSGGLVKVAASVDPILEKASGQSPATSNLRLIVSDTGIGIPPEHHDKIFERFHQVSEAHKEVGTGVGLALVKELVALLDGNITVKSEVGKGTEFRVELPLEIIRVSTEETDAINETNTNIQESRQTAPSGQTANTVSEDTAAKPHILVVEDNADLRAFIIDSLGDEFHFLEAENGKQGLEIAVSEVPDLIISDVMMPEMDGMTMTSKIKGDIRSSHIPLILLTAKSTEDSKLSGLQSGADDYLTKPFNKNELLLKVRNGVKRQLKLREKLRAELMSSTPKVEVLSADEQFLNKVKEAILNQLSDEQLSVESLAEDIGLSRVQLYRKISALTGMSVNELIRKLRLQKAAQLLAQNWGPVSQVAYEVGFSNLSYFSKVFKEEFGTLPSEYVEKV